MCERLTKVLLLIVDVTSGAYSMTSVDARAGYFYVSRDIKVT
jgi:hypothetical protein